MRLDFRERARPALLRALNVLQKRLMRDPSDGIDDDDLASLQFWHISCQLAGGAEQLPAPRARARTPDSEGEGAAPPHRPAVPHRRRASLAGFCVPALDSRTG